MFTEGRKGQKGFTLIELLVVMVVVAIILSLALPRYMGARRKGFLAEADYQLQELKTMAWAYYTEYSGWTGITSANFNTTLSMTPPPDSAACWDLDMPSDGTASQIIFRATGDSDPVKCTPVLGYQITLTMNGDGSASRATNAP